MIPILSVITSVKDYVEIVHKLIETDSNNLINNYYDFGAIITYLTLGVKQLLIDLFSFNWLRNLSSLPVLIPEITSAMISEISVFDGYFHNAFTLLENPVAYGDHNYFLLCLEKLTVGLLNSVFLCLPTSIAHIITLRRFIMQGLEAGYIAGLGTIAGNVLWIGSVIFGLRFIIIPWLSLDIFRYLLGFILLVKYMWDSYSERRSELQSLSKWKIFSLNFFLAFTEQSNIYPFINNLSIGSDSTILESFPANNFMEFLSLHSFYLLGILIGSFSLLQLTYWFLENPAFNFYMWMISSFKGTSANYSKFFNFFFLYLTMTCCISNIAYFGLDYTITKPLGFVHEDRLIDQKMILETSFINSKASDRNTRRNRGRHGRRERWKRRVRRYRTFDASLYDQGIYDLFTIEDLNYGFDRFWLRRKMRNHRVRFRFFPGPWMRSFKKQLARPRLESFMGPRVEFFRILFEQVYHPEFHEFKEKQKPISEKLGFASQKDDISLSFLKNKEIISLYLNQSPKDKKQNLRKEYSTLRKFVRKVNMRINTSKIISGVNSFNEKEITNSIKSLSSKRWKEIFSKISHQSKSSQEEYLLNQFSKSNKNNEIEKINLNEKLSKKDLQILRFKTFLTTSNLSNIKESTSFKNNESIKNSIALKPNRNLESLESSNISNQNNAKILSSETTNAEKRNFNHYEPLTLLHPIKFYLQKEQAFQRKLKFYGANVFRTFRVENNDPYFRTLMKRFFYYYKPTLRWEKTMRTATMRKARRKGSRIPRKLKVNKKTQILNNLDYPLFNENDSSFSKVENKLVEKLDLNPKFIQKPTHFYSLVSKRASRYRYQIYKDLLKHWYYSPFNRLLLKFDVDSFIKRQPFSHFLTKNEENLLNLRRFLLHEHYESLRWYTHMEQYRSMKAHIGGTKSFASRLYNQQFQGTFKKIRHLFAITPSSSDNEILRFDQPLYNEYGNNLTPSMVENSIIHEELLADDSIYINSNSFKDSILGDNLQEQSKKVIREYLLNSTPIKEKLIKNLILEKNYSELTQFFYKGSKTRGVKASSNTTNFLFQEKDYLLNENEKRSLESQQKQKFQEFLNHKMIENKSAKLFQQDLWFQLIKKCQNQIYNQEALRLYLSRHVEKRQRQKQRQEKYLKERLERMKKYFLFSKSSFKEKPEDLISFESPQIKNNLTSLSTALQKSIKDGIYFQKNFKKVKTNIRNNRFPINWENMENKFSKKEINPNNSINNYNLNKSLKFQKFLENRQKECQFQIIQIEKDVQNSLSSFNKIQNQLKKDNLSNKSFDFKFQELSFRIKKTISPFSFISKLFYNKILSQPLSFLNNSWKQTPDKDFHRWRQDENVLTKRQKIRKTLKRLKNTNPRNLEEWKGDEIQKFKPSSKQSKAFSSFLFKKKISDNSEKIRQKNDVEDSINQFKNQRKSHSWQNWRKSIIDFEKSISTPTEPRIEKFSFLNFVTGNAAKFKRKRSRLRRYRRMKGRGPIKKRTLGEKLKRQFRLFKKYSRTTGDPNQASLNRLEKKVEIFQLISKRKYEAESEFKLRDIKQRRTRIKKHRFWKKHKKPKYAQNKRKQRKRRRYAIGKIRLLNKEIKRLQSNLGVKQWWWQTFLPSLKAKNSLLWQTEMETQIENKISQLSLSNILDRDEKTLEKYREKIKGENLLQIGDKDFKPLSTPQALRIRNKLANQNNLSFGNKDGSSSNSPLFLDQSKNLEKNQEFNEDVIGKITTNLLIGKSPEKDQSLIYDNQGNQNLFYTNDQMKKAININSTPFFQEFNPLPFYAGWDENLRQFVVTNRLLSTQEATYSLKFNSLNSQNQNLIQSISNSPSSKQSKDSKNWEMAPLKGMNAATTLYWQVPFTTYDPDQFFALGLDGFSPIGWRKFHFRHSKQTTKPLLVKTKTVSTKNSSNLEFQIQTKIFQNQFTKVESNNLISQKKRNDKKNEYRKIQKRYKKVKKHPRPPVYFPSGPLTKQVLPVHYIYVFYKRYRLPRDRYIRRRLHKNNDNIPLSVRQSILNINDFTLRRRVKPKRKYHRKTNSQKNDYLILKRRKFIELDSNFIRERQRPLSQTPLNALDEKALLSSFTQAGMKNKLKQKRKSTQKQQSENLRVRQLRRRIQRQVIRPTWRYRPRSGGFTWPGDYLRLELIRLPRLTLEKEVLSNQNLLSSDKQEKIKQRKIKKKKRRTIQEWQIQPKKHLLQKHNLKVLKTRLLNSQSSNKIYQKDKLRFPL
jgi:hypothetical protein